MGNSTKGDLYTYIHTYYMYVCNWSSFFQVDRIQLFASMDIFKRHQDATGSIASSSSGENSTRKEDFEDLGRSARLKEIEKGFQDVPEDQQCEKGNGDSEIKEFEMDWFSFLEE